jgi:hypothetical protein
MLWMEDVKSGRFQGTVPVSLSYSANTYLLHGSGDPSYGSTRLGRSHRRCRLRSRTGEAVACVLSICAEVRRTRGLRAAFERSRFRRA